MGGHRNVREPPLKVYGVMNLRYPKFSFVRQYQVSKKYGIEDRLIE